MRASIIAIVILMTAVTAGAQRRGRMEVGLALQHWESADSAGLDVSQLVVPFRLDLPLGRRLGLSLRTNPGRTVLEASEEELSAAGNVILKTSWYVLDQTALLRAGVSIPTSSTRLTEEELPIAALVASDELGFAMDSPVDGPCATIGAAVAHEFGGTTAACGVGYTVRASYQPYEDAEEELDPGEELIITAGVYRRIALGSAGALLKSDAAVVLYGRDLWDGGAVRKLGPRTEIRGLLTTSPGGFDPIELSIWARLRAKGMVPGDSDLVAEEESSFGPEGAVRLRMGYVMTPWLKAEVSGFARFEGDNGYGVGGGRVFGASIGPRLRIGRATSLSIRGGTLSGTAWTVAGDTDLSGYEVRSMLVRTW